jgi:hypothetical protein
MLAAAYYNNGAGLLRPIVRGKTRCRGNGRYRDRESNPVYGCLHGFIWWPQLRCHLLSGIIEVSAVTKGQH